MTNLQVFTIDGMQWVVLMNLFAKWQSVRICILIKRSLRGDSCDCPVLLADETFQIPPKCWAPMCRRAIWIHLMHLCKWRISLMAHSITITMAKQMQNNCLWNLRFNRINVFGREIHVSTQSKVCHWSGPLWGIFHDWQLLLGVHRQMIKMMKRKGSSRERKPGTNLPFGYFVSSENQTS